MEKDRGKSGQLILIGGLLVALAIIAIALTIGGGLFSQNTVEDKSLSVFSSTIEDRVDTSLEVSRNNLQFYNNESIKAKPKYPEEICGKFVNATRIQNIVSNRLGESQTVTDIRVEENCGSNKTWLTGQSEAGIMPAVNISEPVPSTEEKACAELHFETGFANPDYRQKFIQELKGEYPGRIPAEPNTSDIITALEDEHTINMDLVKNDDELTEQEYVTECIDIVFETGRQPIDVVFAIDTTGSMSNNNKMGYTKQGAKAAVDDLTKFDKVGLVEYNTYLGDRTCVSYFWGVCWSYEYNDDGAEAKLGGDMNKLQGGWSGDLKTEIDSLSPGGGTDITTGLEKSMDVLSNGKRGLAASTRHIVIMTDGQHTQNSDDFSEPEPEDYIEEHEDEYENVFIHTVALSTSGSINEDTLEKLANEDGEYSDVRPNGTSIQSENPEDAEELFKDIIGEIEDETEIRENATGTTPDPDKKLKSDTILSSGTVERIDDVRMNVTDFTGFGDYIVRFTDTNSGSREIAWEMTINNTNMSSVPITGEPPTNVGYKLEFRSDTNSDLNDDIYINHTPTGRNLSQPGEYVWLDLTNKNKSKPRLDTGSSFSNSFDDHSDKTEYMKEAWQEVRDETEPKYGGDGIAISAEERNIQGSVRGIFSLEFKPIGGNFEEVGNISGGAFSTTCDDSTSKRLPPKCSLNNNSVDAVSTTILKDTSIVVTIEGPSGTSTREIRVPSEGKYEYDILE